MPMEYEASSEEVNMLMLHILQFGTVLFLLDDVAPELLTTRPAQK